MSSNDQRFTSEKPAVAETQTSGDPLSPDVVSEDDGDDRINPIEKSFTDEGNPLEDSNDFDDMTSLLPTAGLSDAPAPTKSNINSLEIGDGDDDDNVVVVNNTKLHDDNYCFGLIQSTRSVGNMRILFPEYFNSSGWGVMGPQMFGPVVVFLILVAATHGVINGIKRHNLGIISVVICYLFLAVSTYRLTDVCFRDPGICLDQEIPGHESPERASQYRYCDRCKVWQPPDGVHCPECNVCVAGYDHYCVWMGTCIGKRNYRQFVKFNLVWMLYIMYAFFWVVAIGPLVMKHVQTKT